MLVTPLVQFISVTNSCPTLGDPMDCSTPGFPVHHHLPEFAQTYVHCVSDVIQPSHPLSPPSPLASWPFPASGSFPMSQLFASGGQVLELQLQPQPFQWIFKVNFLKDRLVWSPCCPRDSQESFPASMESIESINATALSLLLWSNSHIHTCLLPHTEFRF